MATTVCRACGQPATTSLEFCTHCGVPTTEVPAQVSQRPVVASWTRLVVVGVLVGLVIAVLGAYLWPSGTHLVAVFPLDASGGHIVLAGGASLDFPAGAVTRSYEIAVHRRDHADILDYIFDPEVLDFAQAVTVTIPQTANQPVRAISVEAIRDGRLVVASRAS